MFQLLTIYRTTGTFNDRKDEELENIFGKGEINATCSTVEMNSLVQFYANRNLRSYCTYPSKCRMQTL